jgi:hypothetical protein
MTTWNILRPFGIIYSLFGIRLWSFGIFFRFGFIRLDQEKSGSPAADAGS